MLDKPRFREVVDPDILGIFDIVDIRTCPGVSKVRHQEVVSDASLDVLNLVIVDSTLLFIIIYIIYKLGRGEKMARGKMK